MFISLSYKLYSKIVIILGEFHSCPFLRQVLNGHIFDKSLIQVLSFSSFFVPFLRNCEKGQKVLLSLSLEILKMDKIFLDFLQFHTNKKVRFLKNVYFACNELTGKVHRSSRSNARCSRKKLTIKHWGRWRRMAIFLGFILSVYCNCTD